MASGQKVQATPAELNSAASLATQTGDNISKSLINLLDEIETTLPSALVGHAGDKTYSVSNVIGDELRGVLEALNKIADLVNQSGKVFGDTDADAGDQINAVAGHISGAQTPVVNALRGVS